MRHKRHWNIGTKLVPVLVGIISLSAVSAVAALSAALPGARSTSSAESPLPAFQSVSIRWSGDSPVKTLMAETCVQVQYTGISLIEIIARVYQVPINQIAGASNSSRTTLLEKYDITANTDHCIPLDQLRQMTRALLNDRFKLVVRNKSSAQKVYVLSIDDNGSRLQNARPGSSSLIEENGDVIFFHNQSISMLCAFLRGIVSNPVLDQTELRGFYDFSLKVQYHGVEGAPGPGPYFGDLSFESIRRSVARLGIQLTIGKSQVPDIFVIDVETPKES